jgi:hypothetical protein
MEGLFYGAMFGGILGMGRDILKTEYNAFQEERKTRANLKPLGFLYQLADMEQVFLCLYENVGNSPSAKTKLDMAAEHLNKVAEIYLKVQNGIEENLNLCSVISSHNKEIGILGLRAATWDMIAYNPDVNVNIVTNSRKSVEELMNEVQKFIHTKNLSRN